MKKLIFLILSVGCISASAMANIPSRITEAFNARYSKATNVEWKHMMGDYKAVFNLGDYQIQAKFDKKGNWVKSEKMIGKDRLPMTVKNSLNKSKYSSWRIRSSYEEYLPNEKPQYHVLAAKGDFKYKSLKFDEHGQLMNG
jgi:hypothetical protein